MFFLDDDNTGVLNDDLALSDDDEDNDDEITQSQIIHYSDLDSEDGKIYIFDYCIYYLYKFIL